MHGAKLHDALEFKKAEENYRVILTFRTHPSWDIYPRTPSSPTLELRTSLIVTHYPHHLENKMYGEGHSRTLPTINTIAQLLVKSREYETACFYFSDALVCSPQHLCSLQSISSAFTATIYACLCCASPLCVISTVLRGFNLNQVYSTLTSVNSTGTRCKFNHTHSEF